MVIPGPIKISPHGGSCAEITTNFRPHCDSLYILSSGVSVVQVGFACLRHAIGYNGITDFLQPLPMLVLHKFHALPHPKSVALTFCDETLACAATKQTTLPGAFFQSPQAVWGALGRVRGRVFAHHLTKCTCARRGRVSACACARALLAYTWHTWQYAWQIGRGPCCCSTFMPPCPPYIFREGE